MRRQAIVAPGVRQLRNHPHAILLGDTLFIGGRPSFIMLEENDNTFGAHADKLFRDTREILRAVGLSYENAMKFNVYVGQFGPDYGQFEQNYLAMRNVRGRYLPDTRWAATGVEIGLTSSESSFEMEVTAGFTEETVISPNVWLAPGPPRFPQTTRTAHAARVGNVHYVQGQVAWDLQGNPVGVGDIDIQVRHSYSLLNHILKALNVTWGEVIKVTTFLRHAEHFKKLTEGQDRHIAPSQCAATTVLAAPVDGLLEEPELIVATSCEKTLISAPDVYNDRGHAHAVKAGDTIYTSAQIPVDKNGNLPSEEFEAQAEQVFLNLGSVLKAARASWSQVVKMNTYLRRREDYATLVGIRDRYMPESSVVVTDLVSGPVDPRFLLQAECVVATS